MSEVNGALRWRYIWRGMVGIMVTVEILRCFSFSRNFVLETRLYYGWIGCHLMFFLRLLLNWSSVPRGRVELGIYQGNFLSELENKLPETCSYRSQLSEGYKATIVTPTDLESWIQLSCRTYVFYMPCSKLRSDWDLQQGGLKSFSSNGISSSSSTRPKETWTG